MNSFFNFFFLLLIASTITTTSCNNDDNALTVGDDCSASWKVDGESYSETDLALCAFIDEVLSLNAGLGTFQFQLQIDPITTTGTYNADISNTDQDVVVFLTTNNGNQLAIINGAVVVTELSNGKAKGTFSGQFYDIMDLNQTPAFSVTDGQFSANF